MLDCIHVILAVNDVGLQISLLFMIIMGPKHEKVSSAGATKAKKPRKAVSVAAKLEVTKRMEERQ
jgi:hypothetical protein